MPIIFCLFVHIQPNAKKLFCVSLCLWIVLLLHSDALKYREKYFLASFSWANSEFSCNCCVSFEKRFMRKTIFFYDSESNVIIRMKNIFCFNGLLVLRLSEWLLSNHPSSINWVTVRLSFWCSYSELFQFCYMRMLSIDR